MNILAWNRQGIANRRTRHALKLLIHKHQINLVFFVWNSIIAPVPNIKPCRMLWVFLMWYTLIVSIELEVSHSCGMILSRLMFDKWSFSSLILICCPRVWILGDLWAFMSIRRQAKDIFPEIYSDPLQVLLGISGLWLEILSSNEKSGGALKSFAQMAAFRDALHECDLDDMGAAGGPFTWSAHHTTERLDRGVCTQGWRDKYLMSRVVVLPPSRSDHKPILIEVWDKVLSLVEEDVIFILKKFGLPMLLFLRLWMLLGPNPSLVLQCFKFVGKLRIQGSSSYDGTKKFLVTVRRS